MRTYYNIVGICLLLFALQACKEESKKSIKTQAITFKKEGDLSIYKKTTDSLLIKMDIEIAESDYETQTGLMYRSGMKDTQGMLFIFPEEKIHAFYMKNTQFPLDIIYIKADRTIASFQKNARPFSEKSLSSQVAVQYVLEVNAGLVEKWHLEIGDKIEF